MDAVLAGLSARQLREWQAHERLEGGLGTRAVWQSAALLAALYAEARRDRQKRRAPFTELDFLPWVERAAVDVPRTLREQLRLVRPVVKGKQRKKG